MNSNQMRYLEFGEFRLDLVERVLLRHGEKISLTHKAFHLLLILIENKGHLLKHNELMEKVWQETTVDQSSLKQNIALLRKALGDTTADPKFIQTMPKYGYRFIAPVKPLLNENIALIAERHTFTQIDILEELSPPVKMLKPAVFNRQVYWIILAICIVGMLVFSVFTLQIGFSKHPNSQIFAVNNIVPSKLTEIGNVERGVISPNGEFVVFNTYNPASGFALWVRRVENKDSIQLVAPSMTEKAEAFTVTNDGNWVYYVATKGDWGRQATLYRISILGGKPHKILEHLDSYVSFSPDDKQFVFNRFTEQGCQLITANALDGSNEQIIAQGKNNGEFIEPKWSPDGKKILYYDIERRKDGNFWSLSAIALEDKKITNILPQNRQHIRFLAWTPDGNIAMNASDPNTKLGQIYSVSYPAGKIERTTNDLFNYMGVSVGGNSIVSNKTERTSDILISDAEHLNIPPQKITSGYFDSFEWTNDGRIVYVAASGAKRHLWIMKADGSQKEQISPDEFDESLPDISTDNRFVAFISNRSGTNEVWMNELDGRNPKQLTSGNPRVWHPRFSADGASVFFEMSKNENTVLANVKIDSGQISEIVSDVSVIFYDLSPDGKAVVYSFEEKLTNKIQVAIRSLETGEVTKLIDLAPARFLRFSPDGKSLIYKKNEESAPVSTVWIRPIEGGNERQFADFKKDEIFWFDISQDGKRLAYITGKPSSDLILLKSTLRKEGK